MSNISKPIIAIYGGTFNPPHKDHIRIANTIADREDVRKVYVMPAAQNPWKAKTNETTWDDRYAMCFLAFNHPKISVSGLEYTYATFKGEDYVYSIELLDFIRDELNAGDVQYRLVIGSDCLNDFDKWYDYKRIITEYGLFVVNRLGIKFNKTAEKLLEMYSDNISLINIPELEGYSSTELRKRIAAGESWAHMTDIRTTEYILNNEFYKPVK